MAGNEKNKIVMADPFPPPVHGKARGPWLGGRAVNPKIFLMEVV